MPAPARHGDIAMGICPCHKKPVSWIAHWVSTTTVLTEGQPRVNMSCVAISSCGHMVVPITGSSTVFIQGSQSHRVGDTAQNCGMGVTMTGAATVNTGG